MRHMLLFRLPLVVAALCGACNDEGSEPRVEQSSVEEVVVETDDTVVATVDGVPITASRVEALVKATKRAPREVLEGLVEFELLAAEARQRGLSQGYDIEQAGKQRMVQLFIERDFEATHQPEDIPDSFLLAAYQEKRTTFVHPKLHKVAHILVTAYEGKATEARRGEARKLAREIHREASKATEVAEFLTIGKRFDGRDGFTIKLEKLSSLVHKRASLARPFIEATLKLEHNGDISEPTETRFGSHIIFLVDSRAAINHSFEEVRDEIRGKAHPFWLKLEFSALAERLRHSTQVIGYSGPKRRATRL
jgi:hypothetical protein